MPLLKWLVYKIKYASNDTPVTRPKHRPKHRGRIANDECLDYKMIFFKERGQQNKNATRPKRTNPNIKLEIDKTSDFKADKDFLIIVAVIGVVVVAALAVYAAKHLLFI